MEKVDGLEQESLESNCNDNCKTFSHEVLSLLEKHNVFDEVSSQGESETRKELYNLMLKEIKKGNLVLGDAGEVISVKAPNGKNSILYQSLITSGFSEYEALMRWLEVRTKSFLDAFGDWQLGTVRKHVSLASLSKVTGNILTRPKAKEELQEILESLPAVENGKTRLYRIENPNIEAVPDGVVCHEKLVGKWFTDNIDTLANYIRKNQKTEGIRLSYIDITQEQKDERNVKDHPIASGMDVELDNRIIGDSDVSHLLDENGEPLLGLYDIQ